MTSYQQTIDYIYSKLPMFSRVGSAAIKNGFKNILALCDKLGNPQKKGKFIHIAGTNGKGSVSHMLAAILQKQGYKTGLYTSPHLKDLRERIKVNGEMIREDEVIAFIESNKTIIEEIKPSFFEITVAMAFDHFASHQTDYAIIETGLGGRLDSTNIIHPILSIITNIGFDHMQFLGNDLASIAMEKAGIIKPKVPVVIGESHIETEKIFLSKASEENSSIYFADKEYQVMDWLANTHTLDVEVAHKNHVDHFKYSLDLTGIYQLKNLLTVLTSCKVLNGINISIDENSIVNGLANAAKISGLHGRWEVVRRQPMLVLDVAHNVDGMAQVLEQLEISSYQQLRIVIGMVKDKDVESVLAKLPKHAIFYFSQSHVPRALPARELQLKAATFHLEGNVYENVNDAIQEALLHAHTDDLILVCGSVFLVGEVNEQSMFL